MTYISIIKTINMANEIINNFMQLLFLFNDIYSLK